MTIEVVEGDISAQDVDAVVNAANNHFWPLPAFGTGVSGFPLDERARLMLKTVRAHLPTTLRLVRLVLRGARAYGTFVKAREASEAR